MASPKKPRAKASEATPKKRPGPLGSTPRAVPEKERLTRDRIAAAALALIDREGIDALSVRRLAEALHCEAMSLYHYFPSKAHLTDAAIDRVLGEIKIPPAGHDVVGRIRDLAWSFRATALKHPKLFPLLAMHRLNTRVGAALADAMFGLFLDVGLDEAVAARLYRGYRHFITGAALAETGGPGARPSAAEPVPDAEIEKTFPHLATLTRNFKPAEHEAAFKLGLELLLDGMVRLKKASGR